MITQAAVAPVMVAPRRLNALWVGGPPGQTLIKIKGKLRKLNIIVFEQWLDRDVVSKKRIPKRADLVLINKDFIGHPACGKVKDLTESAKEDGQEVMWVYSGLDTIKTTIPNLKIKGIISSGVPPYPTTTESVVSACKNIVPINFEANVAALLEKFCAGINVETSALYEFVLPEIKKKSKRFYDMMEQSSKTPVSFDDIGMLNIIADGERHNLNSWRKEIGTDYRTGQKKMLGLAALGYIKREKPYEGMSIQGKEPNLSYYFSITEAGKQHLGLTEAEEVNLPESTKSPVALEPVAPEPVETPLAPVSRKPTGNLAEALRMALEYAREEEPEVIGLHLDTLTGRVRMEKRSTITLNLE